MDVLCGVPDMLIEDCIQSSGDRKMYKQWKAESKEHREKMAQASPKIIKSVQLKFPKWKPQEEGMIATASAAKIHTKKGAERWWSSMQGDPLFVEGWKPPGSTIFTDNRNGRFRVTFKGIEVISFSWYNRGNATACSDALKWIWGLYVADTGKDMPAALQAFLKD